METKEDLSKLFDKWNQLAFEIENHPKLTEGEKPEILLRAPEKVAPVKFPLIGEGNRKIRYGMHMDMLSCFIQTLRSLKEKTKSELYIQGRIPNEKQWAKLENHPVYEFFLNGRLDRSKQKGQEEILKKMDPIKPSIFNILIPKGKLTAAEAKNYSRMDYNPDTILVGLESMKSGYYRTSFLCELYDLSKGNLAFYPLFAGFNGFSVGSNDLPSGLVMKASLYIIKEFEDDTGDRVISSPLSQKAREQFDDYSLEI